MPPYADLEHEGQVHESTKKSGRGPTMMRSLWKDLDPNEKIRLKFNRYGQPCGLKTCKLTNFIGTLVKGKYVSLAAKNWRKVPEASKTKVWTSVQGIFDIEDHYKPWILKSASKKWKDFKAVLKRMYFNSELSWRQNVLNGCQERIPIKQWAWLVRYWKTEAARIKSERNKATRSLQLNGTHTTGSRGFAVVLDQTELKENRKVGRAELYVITHTKRNGEPLDEYCSDKID